MPLLPDKSNVIYSERNVDLPAGTKASSAYDLALYPELGNAARGVLVVTVILNFKFKEGVSVNPATPGAKLPWSPLEKMNFMSGMKTACNTVWAEKHRLTTASSIPAIKDVGVIFDIQTSENMGVTTHSHWNCTTTKKEPGWIVSSVKACGGWFTNGESILDSEDLTPANKGGPQQQRDGVHEFGHMLGLRDEYPVANDNMNWLSDQGSIMHFSETVRPRHYVFFADWIGRQWQDTTSLIKSTEWKVNGTINLLNAQA